MALTTLTVAGLSLSRAQQLAALLEADADAVSVNETDEAQAIWETVAYFADHQLAERSAARLGTAALVQSVPEIDWVRRSLEGLAPVAAGRFFLHGSHDRAARRSGGVALEIDAGTAFGTGHHGTTAGCLLALNAILKAFQPQRILDVGCGTGVLAIAAALATRKQVLAGDIDPEAVRVTRGNAHRNGAGHLLRAVVASGLGHRMIRTTSYDLIFANILARPLLALAPDLCRALAPQGTLILSGLTRGQIRLVAAAYRNRGLILKRKLVLQNWAVLVFIKAKRPPRGGRFVKP